MPFSRVTVSVTIHGKQTSSSDFVHRSYMKMDVMEADHLGHIPASFLHSSLQRQLHALPGLSNGGPVNRYAFGISFVYEKGYVQSIVSNWPGFRLKFTEDFTTLGFHGGRPPKDNIYRTSKHTIFVYWLNKEPKALLAMVGWTNIMSVKGFADLTFLVQNQEGFLISNMQCSGVDTRSESKPC